MKKRNFIVILVVGFVSLAGILFYLSRSGFVNRLPGKEPTTQQPAADPGRGEMPGMPGMSQPQPPGEQTKAQPKEQESAEEAPTVEIPLEKQQLIGVKTVEVAVRPLHKIVRTVGRIEYDEKRLATVNTKFEGWIEKLYVDYTGLYVKEGAPLAEFYSPELYATQQEFINVLRWAKKSNTPPGKGGNEKGVSPSVSDMLSNDADRIVEAARQRLKLWDISDEEIKRVEETGKPIRTLTIYSPVNGYVVQKMVFKGTRVMPGEKLFDVADLSTIWIIADIYEYELPLIKTGETAKISLSYFPGREFTSRIDYVYPTLSGETRTAKVRFSIPNPGGQLKPQMFTDVELKINMGRRLAIPEDAVIDTGMRQIVYVDKGEGYFEPREVTLGLRAEGLVEVLKGLKEKEKIASAANFLIDSEAKLKGVVK
ncbi:MAG: efflux RND transporter periplasmic adaptor subunit [Nitrospirae bacterium]|nr:efflux RND transporter periplasmic adaptor subunit [Nitrospirota bacterium]